MESASLPWTRFPSVRGRIWTNSSTTRSVIVPLLTVAASIEDNAARRDVAVQPVNTTTEKNLLYRAWVETNRSYVAKASGGRLGYVHMFDMSEAALAQLSVDLDVENQGLDGVIVDVRNNTGGFVNVYAIDVFARRNYLTISPRGRVPAAARSWLGQRALGSANDPGHEPAFPV